MKQTPRVEQSIRAAERLASNYGQDFVGTEHLLLALAADPNGIASRVLEDLGVRAKVQEELKSILTSSRYQAGGPLFPPPE